MNSAFGITWASTDGPVTREQIEEIERYFGVTLPSDYVEVAMFNNGGYPSREAFDFDYKKEAVLNRLLSLHPKKSDYVVNVYNAIRDRLVEGIIPFADDPFGNYLCFDYRNAETPTIVYWDHEIAHTHPERAIFHVCNSFTELLGKLYD